MSSSFEEVLETRFAGAYQTQAYVSHLQGALYRHGFSRPRALLVTALCRDELTGRVHRELASSWGVGFAMHGLAGMLSGGRSALRAAAAHAPMHDGRERLVLVAQAHLAVGASGEIGACVRPGRAEPSVACGALAAMATAISTGVPPSSEDPDDAEFAWLWRRLTDRVDSEQSPDLLALTFEAYRAIVDDANRLMAQVMDTDRADYVVATGINVHGPGERDYVWPGPQYAVLSGQRLDLELAS